MSSGAKRSNGSRWAAGDRLTYGIAFLLTDDLIRHRGFESLRAYFRAFADSDDRFGHFRRAFIPWRDSNPKIWIGPAPSRSARTVSMVVNPIPSLTRGPGHAFSKGTRRQRVPGSKRDRHLLPSRVGDEINER